MHSSCRAGRLGISLLLVLSFGGQFLRGTQFSQGITAELKNLLDFNQLPGKDESKIVNDNNDGGVKRPPHLADQITIIMLTADRKRFVDLRDLVEVGSNHSRVEEIIIIWNNPDKPEGFTMLQEKLGRYTNGKLRIVQSTKNSLNNRFDTKFLKVRTGAVLILDDDMTILPDTIDCVYESWLAKKTQVHSFGHKRIVYEGGYTTKSKQANRHFNFILPRFLLATDYLDVYFDPIHTAIRQYVDTQEAHCDDIAFASVVTKHIGKPLVFVPAPYATRLDTGENKFYNTLQEHAKQVSKEFTQSVGISDGNWSTRQSSRDECSRAIVHMLNWVMPTVENAQCAYSRSYPEAKGKMFLV